MKRKALKAALPLHPAHLRGFLFLGISYGFLMRRQMVLFCISFVHQPVHLCGSMEFVTAELLLSGLQSPARFSAGPDGQRAAPVLRAVHAAEVPGHRHEKVLSDLWHVLTSPFPSTAPVTPPPECGQRLVHVLCHPAQPHLLGDRLHSGGASGVCHPL